MKHGLGLFLAVGLGPWLGACGSAGGEDPLRGASECRTHCSDDGGDAGHDGPQTGSPRKPTVTHDAGAMLTDPDKVPTTRAGEAMIGPAGGVVSLSDGAAVEIPPSALSTQTRIAVRMIAPPAPLPDTVEAHGETYAFEPHGTRFRVPVTLRLPYDGAADVVAMRLDDEQDTTWETVPGGKPALGGVLALPVSSFSVYGVVSGAVVPDAAVPVPDAAAPVPDAAVPDAAAPLPCEPLVPLAGETCYDFRAHAVSSPSDTSEVAVATGESVWFFYFDVPWAAGTLASRLGFAIDNAAVVADASLFESSSSSANGTVAANVTGTLLGDNAALIDAWGPGGCELALPADVGLHLPAPGRRVQLAVHYANLTGAVQSDGSTYRVCTVAPGSRANIAGLTILGTENLGGVSGMPPGTSTFSGTCVNDSSAPITILSLAPHAHALGTHMKAEATLVAGGSVLLLDQPYDFNFQVRYDAGAFSLAAGDSLTASCTFVNGTGASVSYGISNAQEQCYQYALSYPYLALDNGVLSLLGPTNTCW